METKSNSATGAKPRLVRLIFRWLFLVAGAVALFLIGLEVAWWSGSHSLPPVPQSRAAAFVLLLVHVVVVAFILALVAPIFRWMSGRAKWINRLRESLFTWRTARRLLIGVAVLATLIALFYVEENWRGKRAWEQRKRDFVAKGEVLDWNAYIPPPVSDDENIMKAPKMADWFVKLKPGANITNGLRLSQSWTPLSAKTKPNQSKEPVLLVRLVVVPANSSATNGADAVLWLDTTGAAELLGKFVQDAVGPYAISPQGFGAILRQPLSQIKPGRVLLQADAPQILVDVSRMLPTNSISTDVGRLRVEADAKKESFRILLAANPTISAEAYLAESDRFASELDMIREALKRPRIRMDGDYQRPFEIPLVNFVNIRNVAQVAAQRAQCCLLLGKSEQAFRELSLIFELRRLLTSKPTTLVAAMIDVAISGLYAQTIADGFRLQAWREPELIALQAQLQQMNLLLPVAEAFHMERVALCHTLETSSGRELARLFSLGRSEAGFWKRVTDPMFLLVKFAPRGWLYQNLAVSATVTSLGAYDAEHRLIKPGVAEAAARDIERVVAHRSPYTILAAIALPNFTRATQATARNQTWVNQAFIVCGLERFRLAHGSYPENLDALVPQFVEKLPPDIIGGQPLHYRRTEDGQFVLYSIGWNEKDDGGERALTTGKPPGVDYAKGDWVWPLKAR